MGIMKMTGLQEATWRMEFWNQWESWEEGNEASDLRWTEYFHTPQRFMEWAETPQAELGGLRPWEYTRENGAQACMAHLMYLLNKGYWEEVCADWVSRHGQVKLYSIEHILRQVWGHLDPELSENAS